MFQLVAAREGGDTYSLPVLQVLPTHGLELSDNQTLTWQQLDQVPHMSGRLWGQDLVPETLVEHVVREAVDSDLVLGDEPEKWSPLGKLDPASFGRWIADEELWSKISHDDTQALGEQAVAEGLAEFSLGTTISTGVSVVRMAVGGEVDGAVLFGAKSFLVPVLPGTSSMDISYTAETDFERAELAQATASLGQEIPEAAVTQTLLWRVYVGTNTVFGDGISSPGRNGLHRIALQGARRGGALVARVLFSIHRDTRTGSGDPMAVRRRVRYERKHPDVAQACPDIRSVDHVPTAVVAVHGTMSCAVPLAAALRNSVDPVVPVLRYEHDTWLPVGRNAEDLVGQLVRIGCSRVCLVAHSRGGLVSRNAAEILASRGGPDVDLLTLGTPFLGTPIVDGVRVGMLGVRALLGGLRVAGGFSVVDPGTRLAGLLIWSRLPEGLEAMSPDSAYLSGFVYRQPERTRPFAGVIEETGDGYGLAFATGFAEHAFAGAPNDLIVSASSAAAGLAEATTLTCDHFSYLLDPQVQAALKSLPRKTPEETLTW